MNIVELINKFRSIFKKRSINVKLSHPIIILENYSKILCIESVKGLLIIKDEIYSIIKNVESDGTICYDLYNSDGIFITFIYENDLEFFITMADYRENQIKSILDENS